MVLINDKILKKIKDFKLFNVPCNLFSLKKRDEKKLMEEIIKMFQLNYLF